MMEKEINMRIYIQRQEAEETQTTFVLFKIQNLQLHIHEGLWYI